MYVCLITLKDIMDTTAISLPDVSVNHLQQVLGLIYGGKTLINGEDEVEVFHLMNMLGFPANDLECRAAREHDVDHVAVVRHIPNDDSSTCTRDSSTGKEGRENVENKDEDVDGKEESCKFPVIKIVRGPFVDLKNNRVHVHIF